MIRKSVSKNNLYSAMVIHIMLKNKDNKSWYFYSVLRTAISANTDRLWVCSD